MARRDKTKEEEIDEDEIEEQVEDEEEDDDVDGDEEGEEEDEEGEDEDGGSEYETYNTEDEELYEGEENEDGDRHGHGTLYTADGFIMEGEWVNGTLNGPGSLIFDDILIKGTYVDGEFEGQCTEYTLEKVRTFEGQYKAGERHGPGILYNIDGSRIEGTWKNSILCGECCFYYPDDRFFIKGTWKKGEFVKGTVSVSDSKALDLKSLVSTTQLKRDESDSKKISSNPMLPDAFEQYYCYVKKSEIPNSGEGLFAAVDIPADRLVSYYNGLRIDPKLADDRDWSFNSNTMYLDKETYIDIPPEWSSTSKYCASLGHKANHSKNNNTVYRPCYHPRFGDIKCIRSIKPIAKDQEILVDYDYEEKDKPQWYIDLEKQAAVATDVNKNTTNSNGNGNKKLKTKN
ncbi:histone-lysine N-methyltransferase [Heterostelium album PN500]|uniref:Histone-lysine N-methyltransferase SETD7 n=1 Tax=Heterostelium pallidum (strain ATCC 26659 / Pp 5 / PN500) TaxID=670386 RepID=D3BL39_HETP5|nr:histone-lysine N-methyltransferase [Heterostelium album PN500]EFA77773.1 histone-lysine N-methyltransferase [Heterostelium album PN500]|eukprot:XP_020429901.1 histone-lysine N-methyltransferase [Heterostelium album PN500]